MLIVFMCLITTLSGNEMIMKRLLKVISRFNEVMVDFLYKKRVFPEILTIYLKKYLKVVLWDSCTVHFIAVCVHIYVMNGCQRALGPERQ